MSSIIFHFCREICEICRFLFSEEMFLSVIFILTAFRNPTIIKALRSALSCKLCWLHLWRLCSAAGLLFSFFRCCGNIKMPRQMSRHFYGGRYRTWTCDPPHVKRMLIPAELIVRVSVGYSNASVPFCQPPFFDGSEKNRSRRKKGLTKRCRCVRITNADTDD